MLDDKTEAIARKVVHSAFTVHSVLGPGLIESVYEVCFCHELKKAGFGRTRVEPRVPLCAPASSR